MYFSRQMCQTYACQPSSNMFSQRFSFFLHSSRHHFVRSPRSTGSLTLEWWNMYLHNIAILTQDEIYMQIQIRMSKKKT